MPRPSSGIDRRIVKAAHERFLALGVDGASLREIAEKAKTSIGMVYYYFPSKDDLFLAVVEDVYETILALFEMALAADAPVPVRLSRLYEAMGGLEQEQLSVLRLVLREALSSPARLHRLAERFKRGHIPLVLGLVSDGQADGTFDSELPPWLVLVSMMAMGALPQIAPRLLGLSLSPPVHRTVHPPSARTKVKKVRARSERLSATLVDLVLGGVGKKPR